jgi:hypothetical protein
MRGVVSTPGLFYCGYSPFGLVAGSAVDRLGLRSILPVAAAVSLLPNADSAGLVLGRGCRSSSPAEPTVFAQPRLREGRGSQLHEAESRLG